MGIEIDQLTEEQERYLASWQGTSEHLSTRASRQVGARPGRPEPRDRRLGGFAFGHDRHTPARLGAYARVPPRVSAGLGRTGSCAPEEIVRLEDDRVVVLDQRRLPDEEVELAAVRGRGRRGDPDARGARCSRDRDRRGVRLRARCTHAARTSTGRRDARGARPTAVNLAWALDEMRGRPDTRTRARAHPREEVDRCRQMAAHAGDLFAPGSRVLTHCNAGGLATGGYGTALGALRAAWERGLVEHVCVDETRPLLQGAG